ncbi:MAG TPA: porin [Terriglobales bacterium]|nr:porin [Terriglobales bacterium]
MRSLTAFFLLLLFMSPALLVHAQGTQPASKTGGSTPAGATKEEVNELRSEVAAQRKTIEELKAMVQQLVGSKAQAADGNSAGVRPAAETGSLGASVQPVSGGGTEGVHLVNTVLIQPEPGIEAAMINQAKPAAEPKKEAPLTAGWNGEHFFIKSADGQFQIMPYGYVDIDHRAYKGDGAPSDTFVIRRARFGFQGNYGSHFDYAILTDANATTGAIVRDVYLNVRLRPEFQLQAGQFKEPFAQETGIGATNLDFVERGLQSLLYPCAGTAFRCPGAVLHGDISGGVVQWWAGAFNGRNGVTANATNEPEFVGRLRFYPWRKSKKDLFKQLAFGGSISHGRSRGLSGDLSFSGLLPDATYAFFPQLRINGPTERYEGEFTYIKSGFALRGEYVQLQQQRYAVGSETPGGLAFLTIPGVGAKAWNIGATYLLTGEKRPENGTPRVKRPLLGPDTPGGKGRGWGAWEVAARYSGIQANAPASSFLNFYTPGFVPAYDYHTDQITFGVNWYLNYWVKYQFNVNIDQLKQPSITGQVPQNFYALTQELQFRF